MSFDQFQCVGPTCLSRRVETRPVHAPRHLPALLYDQVSRKTPAALAHYWVRLWHNANVAMAMEPIAPHERPLRPSSDPGPLSRRTSVGPRVWMELNRVFMEARRGGKKGAHTCTQRPQHSRTPHRCLLLPGSQRIRTTHRRSL